MFITHVKMWINYSLYNHKKNFVEYKSLQHQQDDFSIILHVNQVHLPYQTNPKVWLVGHLYVCLAPNEQIVYPHLVDIPLHGPKQALIDFFTHETSFEVGESQFSRQILHVPFLFKPKAPLILHLMETKIFEIIWMP